MPHDRHYPMSSWWGIRNHLLYCHGLPPGEWSMWHRHRPLADRHRIEHHAGRGHVGRWYAHPEPGPW